jgi:hypothetical protein
MVFHPSFEGLSPPHGVPPVGGNDAITDAGGSDFLPVISLTYDHHPTDAS